MSIRKVCDNYLCFAKSINNYEKYCVNCFNKTHIPYTLYITTIYVGSPTNKLHQEKYINHICDENSELYNTKIHQFLRDIWDNLEFKFIEKNVIEMKFLKIINNT